MVTFRLQRPTLLRAGAPAAAFACSAAWASPAAPPDVVFLDGKIVTLDSKGTIASAAAVKSGRFVAVGSDDAIRRLVGPRTRVVKLEGKAVIPGIIDAHCHPMPTMLFTTSVAKAMENLAARVRTTTASPSPSSAPATSRGRTSPSWTCSSSRAPRRACW